MNVDRLPRILRNTIDIYELNRRLVDGETSLDWSNVQVADRDALEVLLTDVDPTRHVAVIGLPTIPESLRARIELVRPGMTSSDAHSPTDDTKGVQQQDNGGGHGRSGVAPPDLASTVLTKPSKRALRDELQRAVLHDLLGPAGGPEEEIAENSVRDRYLVGMLAPQGEELDPEQDDELAVASAGTTEEGQADVNTTATRSLSPSSFGLTFTVTGEASRIVVTAR